MFCVYSSLLFFLMTFMLRPKYGLVLDIVLCVVKISLLILFNTPPHGPAAQRRPWRHHS